MTPAKRQYSAQARKYACELIADASELIPPYFSGRGGPVRNSEMQYGVDTEPEARRWYALERDTDVKQVGFCLSDDLRFGCSPDGLVGEDGGLELKCPLLKTHAEYLDDGGLPLEYVPQVHGSLIVTGRKWWDFMSYAPGLKPLLIRVFPDDFTEALRKCLDRFWTEYIQLIDKLKTPERGDAWEPAAAPLETPEMYAAAGLDGPVDDVEKLLGINKGKQ